VNKSIKAANQACFNREHEEIGALKAAKSAKRSLGWFEAAGTDVFIARYGEHESISYTVLGAVQRHLEF
jgi:hypothetical protein